MQKRNWSQIKLYSSVTHTQSAMQTDNEIEPDFTNIVKVSQIENRFAL